MRTTRLLIGFAPFALAATGAAWSQQAIPVAEESVNGMAGPVATAARLPGVRRAADVAPLAVELPDTRRPQDADTTGPFQVAGYVEAVAADLIGPPQWQASADGGWVWAVDLHSLNAIALRVELDGQLPDGMEL